MKKLVVLLMVLAFVGTAFIAMAQEKGPAQVKFKVKMGTVTFDHAAHQTRVSDCKTCHHKGVEAGKCTTCHLKKKTEAPKAKDAFHKTCKGCHKKLKKGPTKCKACHVK